MILVFDASSKTKLFMYLFDIQFYEDNIIIFFFLKIVLNGVNSNNIKSLCFKQKKTVINVYHNIILYQ